MLAEELRTGGHRSGTGRVFFHQHLVLHKAIPKHRSLSSGMGQSNCSAHENQPWMPQPASSAINHQGFSKQRFSGKQGRAGSCTATA